MKPNLPQSRHTILWVVILCYFLPFMGLSAYAAMAIPTPKNWNLLSAGLLVAAMGTLILFWLMSRWEALWQSKKFQKQDPINPLPIPSTSEPETLSLIDIEKKITFDRVLKESQEANTKLMSDIETLLNELQRLELEKEHNQKQTQNILADFDSYKQSALQQMEQHKAFINELQGSLAEQKNIVEKKQQQIGHLETKVSDLTYEIKTLLQIAERHSESLPKDTEIFPYPPNFQTNSYDKDSFEAQSDKQVLSSEEASQQLKRCLDIAQKITGSNRFNSQLCSFLDSPADSFTLDLRRLCDSLRNENNSTILLYSPKENQPLFANNQIKVLTGWSPEKFIQNFEEILESGINEWKHGISSLATKNETTLKLSLKTKFGQDVIVHGHLGLIPTGIFRHHAIAILYP